MGPFAYGEPRPWVVNTLRWLGRLWGHKVYGPRERCYWLCLHFASAEEAARWYNEHPDAHRGTYPRLFRTGGTLPECEL